MSSLGVVMAEGLDARIRPEELISRLDSLLMDRRKGLGEQEDAWRQSVRQILRNGTYKPTGRGKPASEHLLRTSLEDAFPIINALVDICNYISLRSLMPVSLWDLDRAETSRFVVRLGRDDESYVFNEAGHSIGLRDLVVGCGLYETDVSGTPLVNPVKDCMKTKTTNESSNVAAIVYAPVTDGPAGTLEEIVLEFRDLLCACGNARRASHAIVGLGETVRI